jgi:nitroimidazol reductase NimA-like FMN-containing flavoprotein (pyridoxamine 5'-phosphate oxidase superfamily)
MQDKYSKDKIKDFLNRVSVMSIAVNLESKPISSVVFFTVDDDLSFYFLTKRNTYKARALNSNHKISLSIWEPNELLVQASGRAVDNTNDKEYKKYFDKLKNINKKLNYEYWPLTAVEGEEYVVYKILVDWVRIMDLSGKKHPDSYHTLKL